MAKKKAAKKSAKRAKVQAKKPKASQRGTDTDLEHLVATVLDRRLVQVVGELSRISASLSRICDVAEVAYQDLEDAEGERYETLEEELERSGGVRMREPELPETDGD